MPGRKMTGVQGLVGATKGYCGGHAVIKGHRIEVSNLVADLNYRYPTPERWIAERRAEKWITTPEIMAVLAWCRGRLCKDEGLTCCHCTLNPREGKDKGDHPFNGWELAGEAMDRILSAMKSTERGHQLPPPWQVFPWPRSSMGWRMGDGEDYLETFHGWFHGLSMQKSNKYAKKYPEPKEWEGFYELLNWYIRTSRCLRIRREKLSNTKSPPQ